MVMGTIEVQLANGLTVVFQDQNHHESCYPTLQADGSLTVNLLDQPGDGSSPAFDRLVVRYDADQILGWSERS